MDFPILRWKYQCSKVEEISTQGGRFDGSGWKNKVIAWWKYKLLKVEETVV